MARHTPPGNAARPGLNPAVLILLTGRPPPNRFCCHCHGSLHISANASVVGIHRVRAKLRVYFSDPRHFNVTHISDKTPELKLLLSPRSNVYTLLIEQVCLL